MWTSDRITTVDAEALPLDGQEFDAIISIDSDHYVGAHPNVLPRLVVGQSPAEFGHPANRRGRSAITQPGSSP